MARDNCTPPNTPHQRCRQVKGNVFVFECVNSLLLYIQCRSHAIPVNVLLLFSAGPCSKYYNFLHTLYTCDGSVIDSNYVSFRIKCISFMHHDSFHLLFGETASASRHSTATSGRFRVYRHDFLSLGRVLSFVYAHHHIGL